MQQLKLRDTYKCLTNSAFSFSLGSSNALLTRCYDDICCLWTSGDMLIILATTGLPFHLGVPISRLVLLQL